MDNEIIDQDSDPIVNEIKYNYLIVTPQQFADGYLEYDEMGVFHKNFLMIRTMDDGSIMVVSPKFDKE